MKPAQQLRSNQRHLTDPKLYDRVRQPDFVFFDLFSITTSGDSHRDSFANREKESYEGFELRVEC